MEFNDFGVVLAAINGVLVFTLIMTLIAQKKTIDEKIRLWARQIGEYKQKLNEAEDKQKRISAELQRMEDRAAAAEDNECRYLREIVKLSKAAALKCPPRRELPQALERILADIIIPDKRTWSPPDGGEVIAAQDAKKCVRYFRRELSTPFIDSMYAALSDGGTFRGSERTQEELREILKIVCEEYKDRLKRENEALERENAELHDVVGTTPGG